MSNVKDIDLTNKKVLLRVDFNVPLDGSQNIIDATRIEEALPTIQYILQQGASLIIMSHLGRPRGKKEQRYSLTPCAHFLAQRLAHPVFMAEDCIGESVQSQAVQLQPGDILLLENLRFHSAEEKPEQDPSFAKQLASLGNVYVNDAFGTAHRKHSSTYTIAQYFPPERKALGFLFEKEIQFLGKTIQNPERPFYALIGGAKISTKLKVLHSLLEKVDALFIGGAMAYTFMSAMKMGIGRSLVERELENEALAICERAKERGISLFLPIDMVVTGTEGKTRIVLVKEGCKENEEGVDIGPKTREVYKKELKKAKTIFWNGPFGKYEEEKFAKGTLELLEYIASLGVVAIIGGGDLVAAAQKINNKDKISHISTGGGASLEYIEQDTLPALEIINTR